MLVNVTFVREKEIAVIFISFILCNNFPVLSVCSLTWALHVSLYKWHNSLISASRTSFWRIIIRCMEPVIMNIIVIGSIYHVIIRKNWIHLAKLSEVKIHVICTGYRINTQCSIDWRYLGFYLIFYWIVMFMHYSAITLEKCNTHAGLAFVPWGALFQDNDLLIHLAVHLAHKFFCDIRNEFQVGNISWQFINTFLGRKCLMISLLAIFQDSVRILSICICYHCLACVSL